MDGKNSRDNGYPAAPARIGEKNFSTSLLSNRLTNFIATPNKNKICSRANERDSRSTARRNEKSFVICSYSRRIYFYVYRVVLLVLDK